MKVGIVGWRGMVGSVLLQRMLEENDFALGIRAGIFLHFAGRAACAPECRDPEECR